MTTFNFRIPGMRVSVFGDSTGVGVELAARSPFRRRIDGPAPAEAHRVVPGATDLERGLAAEIAAINWYHTLDFGDGIVTPGFYDHRPIMHRYELPERLDGMRVLDIATFDGYWAFEFERRGAAEVVALDIASAAELDLAPRVRAAMTEAERNRLFGAGFRLAHKHFKSNVRHVHCNVYDMTPERLGQFDLVHCGDLLLHLRDPILALSRMREMTRGHALISDCIFPDLDRHDGAMMQYEGAINENIWWRFGAKALSRVIHDAGFDSVNELSRFRYGPRGAPPTMWHAVYRAVP